MRVTLNRPIALAVLRVAIPVGLIAVSFCAQASAQGLPAAAQNAAARTAPEGAPEVTYSEGNLQVSANGAGLNQILRQIQRQTGMKITGGVTDERVFGNYGPAPLSEVLASLLDGTGSNMLLVGATAGAPPELILSQRKGGPSPPSPNAMANDDPGPRNNRGPRNDPGPGFQPMPQAIPSRGSMPPSGAFNGIPAAGAPEVQGFPPASSDTATAPASSPGPTAADPSTATTDQQSPNGVKTPQQIYQQLILLQQQQQQQTAPK